MLRFQSPEFNFVQSTKKDITFGMLNLEFDTTEVKAVSSLFIPIFSNTNQFKHTHIPVLPCVNHQWRICKHIWNTFN